MNVSRKISGAPKERDAGLRRRPAALTLSWGFARRIKFDRVEGDPYE